MKKGLLFTLIVLSGLCSFAQNQGILVVYTPQFKNVYVRVDTTEVRPMEEIRLTPGKHAIFLWSPTFKAVCDTVIIEEGKYAHYTAKLQNTDAYSESILANKESKRILRNAAVFTAVIATASIALNTKLYFSYKKATEARKEYSEAISLEDIEGFRKEYEDAKKDFNKVKKVRNMSYIALAGCVLIGGNWGLGHYYKHRIKYRPESNPWLESFTPSYDPITNQFNLQLLFTIK